MKKTLFFLLLVFLVVTPVFASVSGGSASDLGTDVFKPILSFLRIARIILIILIVVVVIVTGIKYASASGDRRSEYLKNGIIVAVVLAIIYFVAFSVPKLLGVSDITISESAVVLKNTLELVSGK